MDGIKQQIHSRQREAMETKHQHEIRKSNRKMRSELNEIKGGNKAAVTKFRQETERNTIKEKGALEAQLAELRAKNKRIVDSEQKRYQRIVSELKTTHKEKIAELKVSQDSEYQAAHEKHQLAMETAREKYLAKMKEYES